jgi:hypothetical protein
MIFFLYRLQLGDTSDETTSLRLLRRHPFVSRASCPRCRTCILSTPLPSSTLQHSSQLSRIHDAVVVERSHPTNRARQSGTNGGKGYKNNERDRKTSKHSIEGETEEYCDIDVILLDRITMDCYGINILALVHLKTHNREFPTRDREGTYEQNNARIRVSISLSHPCNKQQPMHRRCRRAPLRHPHLIPIITPLISSTTLLPPPQ